MGGGSFEGHRSHALPERICMSREQDDKQRNTDEEALANYHTLLEEMVQMRTGELTGANSTCSNTTLA